MKIAANSTATSRIGCQEKSLACRTASGVTDSESPVTARHRTMPARRVNATSWPNSVTRPTSSSPCPTTLAATTATIAALAQPRSRNRPASAGCGSVRASHQSSRKNSPSSTAASTRHGRPRCSSGQKNGTCSSKPIYSGGPSGLSAPPALPASTMKNTTRCTLCRRCALARSSGWISTMDAPTVPITPPSSVANPSIAVLPAGVPRSPPRIKMPPPAV